MNKWWLGQTADQVRPVFRVYFLSQEGKSQETECCYSKPHRKWPAVACMTSSLIFAFLATSVLKTFLRSQVWPKAMEVRLVVCVANKLFPSTNLLILFIFPIQIKGSVQSLSRIKPLVANVCICLQQQITISCCPHSDKYTEDYTRWERDADAFFSLKSFQYQVIIGKILLIQLIILTHPHTLFYFLLLPWCAEHTEHIYMLLPSAESNTTKEQRVEWSEEGQSVQCKTRQRRHHFPGHGYYAAELGQLLIATP